MIGQSEIRRIAEREGVLPTIIDKDWVLGHLLAGIYKRGQLKDQLIFKGGTCLRKCYYSQYRFSEDLDFTLLNPDFQVTKEHFEDILNQVSSEQEIPLFIRNFQTRSYKDRVVGWDLDIRYWGANHSRFAEPAAPERWVDKVKLEIRSYELLVSDPENQILIHPYSDNNIFENIKISCYSLTEIFSEKLRSLIQRSYLAPRDCYDIWYLSVHEPSLDWKRIAEGFYRKSEFKHVEPARIKTVFTDTNVKRLCKGWHQSLGNHLTKRKLPDCEQVIGEIKTLIHSLFFR
jgi:predicted nucleotidyltransferase component of viral defense system